MIYDQEINKLIKAKQEIAECCIGLPIREAVDTANIVKDIEKMIDRIQNLPRRKEK